jgi:hypothetical protein
MPVPVVVASPHGAHPIPVNGGGLPPFEQTGTTRPAAKKCTYLLKPTI